MSTLGTKRRDIAKLEETGEKACTRCGTTKPLNEFYMRRDDKVHQPWCKVCTKQERIDWRNNNREAFRQQNRERDYSYSERAFAILGRQCKRCGFSDLRALQIDHINGGGSQFRKRNGGRAGLCLEVFKDPSAFQVLCANCNWIKRVENNELKCQKYTRPNENGDVPAKDADLRDKRGGEDPILRDSAQADNCSVRDGSWQWAIDSGFFD